MKNFYYFVTISIVIFYSSLNAQWIQTSLDSLGVSSFAVSGTNLFAGTYNGVFLSTDNGTSWTPVNSGLTYTNVDAMVISESNIFVGTDGEGVFRSTNDGTSWTAVDSGLPTSAYVFAFAVSGTNIFAGIAGRGVFLSTNNGTSWTAVSSGLTDFTIKSLLVSGTNLFVATESGVFLSTNNGTNWARAGLINTTVFRLAAIDVSIFAGCFNGVFLSTNNGVSWSPVNSGLTTTHVIALLTVGTNTFAGTVGGGVFLSTNNGTIWSEVNTGLTNTTVGALAVSGTNLFAGTNGSGVWRRLLSEITSVSFGSTKIPQEFTLDQNYPNPFNPITVISWQLPISSHVSLKIYDVLGSEIATLVNEEKPSGNYEVEFIANGLSSGIYFYRLQAGNYVETRKMVLLR